MKQKIEVSVAPAAIEQWPILRGSSETFPNGWEYYIARDRLMHALYKNEGGGYPDKLCGSVVGNTLDVHQRLFFKNFPSAIAWLNNPQPVKQEPETVTFGSLGMGAIFICESQLFIVSEPYANNQARGFGWAVCPEHGFATLFYPDTDVIPFYGTITINVGRGAE